jgi:hypothetical protein
MYGRTDDGICSLLTCILVTIGEAVHPIPMALALDVVAHIVGLIGALRRQDGQQAS